MHTHATHAQDASDRIGQSRDSTARLLLTLFMGLVVILLLVFRVQGINGTQHLLWHFRRVDPWRVYPLMLLAAVPFGVAMALVRRLNELQMARLLAALICMMVTTFAMQLIMVAAPSPTQGLNRIAEIIRDDDATSYFTDAGRVNASMTVHRYLDDYELHLRHMTFHSREKPPGPVLYYVLWMRMLGPSDATAMGGGILIALLATLSIPMTYWMLARLTAERRIALAGSACMALLPCLINIFPMFDQIYPIFTCAMVGGWVLAIRDNRHAMSALFGIALSMGIFFSYCHLVLGAFVVLYSLVHVIRHGRTGVARFTVHAAIGLGTVALAYSILWLISGFDPVGTFFTAYANQQELLAGRAAGREWPGTILPDLQDFILGSGWVSLLLVVFWALRTVRGGSDISTESRQLGWIALAQVLIVALTGFLPSETARVWMFLQPLMLLPIAQELSRWGTWQRNTFFVLLGLITCVQGQNLAFIRGHTITQTLILALGIR